MSLNRRSFLGTGLALGAALSAPCAIGQARPRVVVLGGGAGGATAARYIAKDSDGAIEVVLIEPGKTYYTCFFSNLYLGGFRDFASIAHDYGTLASRYGINVIHDLAVDIDRAARSVTLASGHALGYDRLIVAPGIDFVDGAVPGWDMTAQNRMPHAWKAGSQTQLLKAQIGAMRAGGVFCMVAPPDPFRCPPGPYERVSMVAHVLKESNPTAKILIVDPKENFSKQALFEDGWARHYPGMIQRIGPDFGGANVEVRPDSMEVVIDGMAETVDVCNVIPAQKAGHIAGVAGLADDSGFCPILPGTMQSRFDENVYVLGDATIAGDMPKSAFSANSQAKVAAMQVRAALTGARAFPAKYSNTCWSLIDSGDGVKVGASYQVGEDRIAKVDGFVSQIGEDAALRKATYEESLGWYAGITADIFG
ncbi:NAD(P)/FAD-dependent oxidoreductase [Rhodovulum sulfidophilum]|uniref:Flavocytochrome c flavin subunit n=3 Tax=Rhodovulum sulfidophilum TaxID=35806 RepID=Q939T6_RHOSU|nr:NAD(P)/FAD-dependent oxidoreductase [Rhodovulum sulfidophilum]AAF99439.1 flavocytochrome c flavin subunit [Rhodovulum sulfidophilum]ANB34302.1 flavocytochrome C [Rhodovulum sulfidophilum DSM 1374]ANB38125.1 flavocytochrome C [Rhodovulum sulfidophilum]MBL3561086.1 FAD-dependent oxidoreductase [Rhodovulum sulfidophilum]MBL3572724.1 FAD-dependent oxidoreductase [Rhodovulum sulfidophilum]